MKTLSAKSKTLTPAQTSTIGCTFAPGATEVRCTKNATQRYFTCCPSCASKNQDFLCTEHATAASGQQVRCHQCRATHDFESYVVRVENV